MRRLPLFVLSFLLHALVAWRLGASLPALAAGSLWALMTVSAVLMPLALAMRRSAGHHSWVNV
ncbi:MAG: hypothetical protein EOP93_14465, partial [Lysobacteraceae bacterium]